MKVKTKLLLLFILSFIIFSGCSQKSKEIKNSDINDTKNQIESSKSEALVDEEQEEEKEEVEKKEEEREAKEEVEQKEEVGQKEKEEQEGIFILLSGSKFNLNMLFQNEELNTLNLKELSMLRNSIYAKYGYDFSTEQFKEYFSQFSWYVPSSKNIEHNLSDVDNKNIKNIVALENKKELTIKNSKNDKRYSNDKVDVLVKGNTEKQPLYISTKKLQDYEEGNNPLIIIMKSNNIEEKFESSWNDGVYVSVVDFDSTDEDMDIYITETGTDIGSTTYIYKFNGEKIYKYSEFKHFGREFLYDELGNIYYWFNTSDKMVFNTCFNYKTKLVENIWDSSIKTRVNNPQLR